jgi:hypothetical protein
VVTADQKLGLTRKAAVVTKRTLIGIVFGPLATEGSVARSIKLTVEGEILTRHVAMMMQRLVIAAEIMETLPGRTANRAPREAVPGESPSRSRQYCSLLFWRLAHPTAQVDGQCRARIATRLAGCSP